MARFIIKNQEGKEVVNIEDTDNIDMDIVDERLIDENYIKKQVLKIEIDTLEGVTGEEVDEAFGLGNFGDIAKTLTLTIKESE